MLGVRFSHFTGNAQTQESTVYAPLTTLRDYSTFAHFLFNFYQKLDTEFDLHLHPSNNPCEEYDRILPNVWDILTELGVGNSEGSEPLMVFAHFTSKGSSFSDATSLHDSPSNQVSIVSNSNDMRRRAEAAGHGSRPPFTGRPTSTSSLLCTRKRPRQSDGPYQTSKHVRPETSWTQQDDEPLQNEITVLASRHLDTSRGKGISNANGSQNASHDKAVLERRMKNGKFLVGRRKRKRSAVAASIDISGRLRFFPLPMDDHGTALGFELTGPLHPIGFEDIDFHAPFDIYRGDHVRLRDVLSRLQLSPDNANLPQQDSPSSPTTTVPSSLPENVRNYSKSKSLPWRMPPQGQGDIMPWPCDNCVMKKEVCRKSGLPNVSICRSCHAQRTRCNHSSRAHSNRPREHSTTDKSSASRGQPGNASPGTSRSTKNPSEKSDQAAFQRSFVMINLRFEHEVKTSATIPQPSMNLKVYGNTPIEHHLRSIQEKLSVDENGLEISEIVVYFQGSREHQPVLGKRIPLFKFLRSTSGTLSERKLNAVVSVSSKATSSSILDSSSKKSIQVEAKFDLLLPRIQELISRLVVRIDSGELDSRDENLLDDFFADVILPLRHRDRHFGQSSAPRRDPLQEKAMTCWSTLSSLTKQDQRPEHLYTPSFRLFEEGPPGWYICGRLKRAEGKDARRNAVATGQRNTDHSRLRHIVLPQDIRGNPLKLERGKDAKWSEVEYLGEYAQFEHHKGRLKSRLAERNRRFMTDSDTLACEGSDVEGTIIVMAQDEDSESPDGSQKLDEDGPQDDLEDDFYEQSQAGALRVTPERQISTRMVTSQRRYSQAAMVPVHVAFREDNSQLVEPVRWKLPCVTTLAEVLEMARKHLSEAETVTRPLKWMLLQARFENYVLDFDQETEVLELEQEQRLSELLIKSSRGNQIFIYTAWKPEVVLNYDDLFGLFSEGDFI